MTIPSLSVLSTSSRDQVLGVVIGVSTGGPRALYDVIPNLPADFPVPIVIAQHMPAMFTHCFAERLGKHSLLRVKEAEEGDILKPGLVFIAPGGKQTRLVKNGFDIHIEISDEPKEILYRPCINETFLSAVQVFGGKILGVIMTGMGNDGCLGMAAIKKAGGKTLVQDERSCIVYGMPKAVVDAGMADQVVSLDQIAPEIISMI